MYLSRYIPLKPVRSFRCFINGFSMHRPDGFWSIWPARCAPPKPVRSFRCFINGFTMPRRVLRKRGFDLFDPLDLLHLVSSFRCFFNGFTMHRPDGFWFIWPARFHPNQSALSDVLSTVFQCIDLTGFDLFDPLDSTQTRQLYPMFYQRFYNA